MKAEYIDHLGSDDRVVDAARVSFDKQADQYSDEGNARLIDFLARNGHFTPFTHPQITIRETVPIFVARQRMKHQIGFTYNEVSRRYVDDEPEFYTPDAWRSRPEGSVKQGSGDEEVSHVVYELSPISKQQHHEPIGGCYAHLLSVAESTYNRMLRAGVAPEQARIVLPQSMMTSYYVTGSLAAWARAYRLRADPHAQVETSVLARQWDEIIRPIFPVAWDALTEGA